MDTTSHLASIGIDIGKEVFHIVGFSTDGKIAFRRNKVFRPSPRPLGAAPLHTPKLETYFSFAPQRSAQAWSILRPDHVRSFGLPHFPSKIFDHQERCDGGGDNCGEVTNLM
jgi:hypothetical protein